MLTFSYVQEKAGAAGWPHGDIVLHNSPIVMPLKEWIEHPLVREVVHDGETLQVRPFPRLESIHPQPLWGTGLAHHSLASSAPTSAPVAHAFKILPFPPGSASAVPACLQLPQECHQTSQALSSACLLKRIKRMSVSLRP